MGRIRGVSPPECEIWAEFDVSGASLLFAVDQRMPRQRRLFFQGRSVHVIQRGTGGAPIFHDDDDCQAFIEMASRATSDAKVAVHSFSLMKTHLHLIVTPQTADGLPFAMQTLGSKYVGRFNRKYGRFGSLWAGRYRGLTIGDEGYLYCCMRYVELNAFAAQIVTRPEEHRWTSYRVHACGEPSDWLVPHSLYLALGSSPSERQASYRALCSEPLDPAYLVQQRLAREDIPMSLNSVAAASI